MYISHNRGLPIGNSLNMFFQSVHKTFYSKAGIQAMQQVPETLLRKGT